MKESRTERIVKGLVNVLAEECLQEIVTQIIEECPPSLCKALELKYDLDLTKEEKKKFLYFLEIEYTDIIIEDNEREINDAVEVKKIEKLAGIFKDFRAYPTLQEEIDEFKQDTQFQISITLEDLKQSYDDFKAGKMPKICYEDTNYERIYQARLNGTPYDEIKEEEEIDEPDENEPHSRSLEAMINWFMENGESPKYHDDLDWLDEFI